MTDQIETLTATREVELEEALTAAILAALASFELVVVTAILATADDEGADDEGADDEVRDQLAAAIGTDEGNTALVTAIDETAISAGLGSFFAAIAALATSSVGYVLNGSSTDASTARDNAVKAFRDTFLLESTNALRDTAQRMLTAIGTPTTRAAQIRRTIGLSVNQARSLNAIRQALHTYLPNPATTDIDTLLAFTRGNLSAAQQRMLAKALRDGVNEARAEALLDRHATALRTVRVRAVAGHAVHQLAETAKLTGWQIAQRFGALPADQRRFWKTAGDERVRHAHSQVPGMNRTGVPLGQPFATPLGPCLTPPLEYGCRCKVTLRRTS